MIYKINETMILLLLLISSIIIPISSVNAQFENYPDKHKKFRTFSGRYLGIVERRDSIYLTNIETEGDTLLVWLADEDIMAFLEKKADTKLEFETEIVDRYFREGSGYCAIEVILKVSRAKNVERILEKHFEAIGQDKLSKKQTVFIKSKIFQQGSEFLYTIQIKRPDKVRLEFLYQGMRQITIINGDQGWIIDPFQGDYESKPLNNETLIQTKDEADIDSELFNYKEKGYNLELIGTKNFEGYETFVLKLLKPQAYDKTFYIDSDSYLIKKTEYLEEIQGVEKDVEMILSDYRSINGILFPFNYEKRYGGKIIEMEIENLEFDIEISDSIFEKP